jgi:predicted nucleic acid-binding protein
VIYFADTSFLIGLLSGRDQFHPQAAAWQQHLLITHGRILTTDLVMWEFLNAMAAPIDRSKAVRFYELSRADPNLEIVSFTEAAVRSSVQLYASRPDKGWSLTDCHSFLVMRDRKLPAALTADHHFHQAGFTPLPLQTPPAA